MLRRHGSRDGRHLGRNALPCPRLARSDRPMTGLLVPLLSASSLSGSPLTWSLNSPVSQGPQFLLHRTNVGLQPANLFGSLQEDVEGRGQGEDGQSRHGGQFPAEPHVGLQHDRGRNRDEQSPSQDGDVEHAGKPRMAVAALVVAREVRFAHRVVRRWTEFGRVAGCGHGVRRNRGARGWKSVLGRRGSGDSHN